MVKQYPHTITLTTVEGGEQGDNGNFTGGTPVSRDPMKCRFELNTGNSFIRTADGEKIYHSGTVYLPSTSADVKPGEEALVMDGDKVLSNSKVLKFSRGQLNARLWL